MPAEPTLGDKWKNIGFLAAAGVLAMSLWFAGTAVLPQLSAAFHVSPARAGLSMSVATLAIAVAVIPASALSERWGRARVLLLSVGLAAVLGLLLPLSPNYQVLLTIRALQGIAIAGMPAVAMAYLADEIHPGALAGAVGTFIAGNGLGGLAGRGAKLAVILLSRAPSLRAPPTPCWCSAPWPPAISTPTW